MDWSDGPCEQQFFIRDCGFLQSLFSHNIIGVRKPTYLGGWVVDITDSLPYCAKKKGRLFGSPSL